MTKKVRLKVENAHKKAWVEVCNWTVKLEDILEQLDEDDEDQKELKENLKLESDDTWLEMTEEVGWRWGTGTLVMTREEYENYDWENNDQFELYEHEDAEFYEANDGCWTDISFSNLDCDVDEDELYELMREYGDIEECSHVICGPIAVEIEEEFEEE